MEAITLTADKRTVKKGDSVNISWTSNTPDSLVLSVDDGDTVQRIQVPDSGSRLCWSNRAVKNMVITLVAVVNGKKESKKVEIKVKGKDESSASSAGISKSQLRKERMQARMSVAKAQYQYAWASMKKWQKSLWIVLLLLPIVLLVISAIVK